MARKPRFKSSRSGYEDRIKKNLTSRGIKYEYESIKLGYIKVECPCCGTPVKLGTYTPDFIFKRSSGLRLVVEAKGRFTSADRTKMLQVMRNNPKEDIRFIFQRDQPIRKGSATMYSSWSIKNGFVFTVGEVIPDEWLK